MTSFQLLLAEPYSGYWLGISDLESAENKLVSHITQMEPNYQNWNYGEPSEKYKGARCAKWSTSEQDGKSVLDPGWGTVRCGELNRRVCMKRAGNQCPPGWTYHATG